MVGEYPASLAPGQIINKDDGPTWFFVVSLHSASQHI